MTVVPAVAAIGYLLHRRGLWAAAPEELTGGRFDPTCPDPPGRLHHAPSRAGRPAQSATRPQGVQLPPMTANPRQPLSTGARCDSSPTGVCRQLQAHSAPTPDTGRRAPLICADRGRIVNETGLRTLRGGLLGEVESS